MARSLENMLKYYQTSIYDAQRLSPDISDIVKNAKNNNKAIITNRQTFFTGKILDENKINVLFENCGEEEKTLKGIMCPWIFHKDEDKNKLFTILCVPISISRNGELEYAGDMPFIPREILEPIDKDGIVIGELDTYYKFDKSLTLNSNSDWKDLVDISMDMVSDVTLQTVDSEHNPSFEGYTMCDDTICFIDSKIKATQHIESLYECLVQTQIELPLQQRFVLGVNQTKPLLTEKEELEVSKKHVGTMNHEYPLSLSQRKALHHFMECNDGDVLALNGPPGTGKTTFLQTIVAQLWVKAALDEAEKCPLIVVTSTNNQAVTNVIDSFGTVKGKEGDVLFERWIPDIESFGLWMASETKVEQKTEQKFISYIDIEKGTIASLENEAWLARAKSYFVEKSKKHYSQDVCSVDEIVKKIHTDIKQCAGIIHDKVSNGYSCNVPTWQKILSFFGLCKISEEKIKEQTDKVADEIDITSRAKAFRLASHYWEGKYLLELDEKLKNNRQDKKSPEKLDTMFRRFAKLTPCHVATFYMLPKFYMGYKGKEKKPLTNKIDLLVVDESGQVSPEIGTASFALARKALIVGDTYQIEPVWSLPEHVDVANAKKFEIVKDDKEYEGEKDKGYFSASGNIMRMAQLSCDYTQYQEMCPGMMLIEHRRCDDRIIKYCNELVYEDLLRPMVGCSQSLFPALSSIHVDGKSEKVSGSRRNSDEAKEVASWIVKHKSEIEKRYGKKIEKIVGVITPFAAQKNEIHKTLNEKLGEGHEITVGTVHALQGAEREIVIFSPVYGNNENAGVMFFDRGKNMMNVAVSRAKHSFIVIGNMSIFNPELKTPSGLLARHLKYEE